MAIKTMVRRKLKKKGGDPSPYDAVGFRDRGGLKKKVEGDRVGVLEVRMGGSFRWTPRWERFLTLLGKRRRAGNGRIPERRGNNRSDHVKKICRRTDLIVGRGGESVVLVAAAKREDKQSCIIRKSGGRDARQVAGERQRCLLSPQQNKDMGRGQSTSNKGCQLNTKTRRV